MVSREEATRIALDHLEKVFQGEKYTFVMQPELTKEYQTVWSVRFDTKEHIDTGDMTKAPFTRVLLVPKDGSPPWFSPTAWSTSEFERRLGPAL
jgi:hypothetical protein